MIISFWFICIDVSPSAELTVQDSSPVPVSDANDSFTQEVSQDVPYDYFWVDQVTAEE
ncbi:hypothetical protein [Nitrosomonas sp.]|uniref:hypothetical protein n=1 Tax=Nitrosomonas sp. TaxID=42353 RepID=UPI003305C5B2